MSICKILLSVSLMLFRPLSYLLPKTNAEAWVGLAIGLLVALLAGIELWPTLHSGQQSYPDLVAGYILWTDQFKDGDFRSVYAFLGIAVVSGVVTILSVRGTLAVVCISFRLSDPSRARFDSVAKLLNAGSVADIFGCGALFIAALWIVRGYPPSLELYLAGTVCTVYGVGAITAYLRRQPQTIAYQNSANALLLALLSVVSVIGYCAARFLLSSKPVTPVDLGVSQYVINSLGVGVAVAGAVFLALGGDRAIKAVRILNATLQLTAPLLLAVYARTVYRESSGAISFVSPNTAGAVFLLVIAALMLWDIGRGIQRAISPGASATNSDRLVSISTVVCIGAFLFYGPPPYSVAITDDFHLGETLIPWQQVTDFNQRLYSDFVSVQGFLGLSFGASNWLFFENTLATYPIAAFWVLAIANGVTAVLLSKRLGTGWALLLAPVTCTTLDRVLLVPLTFLLLTSPFLTKTPLRWICGFGAIAALHLLWIPSSGTALILAGSPFAVFCLYQMWRTAPPRREALIFGALLLGILAIIAPLLFGVVRFVMENGSTNTVAYGVRIGLDHLPPNFPRWFESMLANAILWESIRFGGWLAGSFVLLLVGLRIFRAPIFRAQTDTSLTRPTEILPAAFPPFFIAVGGALFCLALIPYSSGRIDFGALSRSGAVSMLVFGFFLPVAAILTRRTVGLWPIPISLVGLALGVRFCYVAPPFTALVERATSVVHVPPDAVNVDGPAQSLPNLGRGYVHATKWDEILRLRAALADYLEPGETYFDLTNRSAFYYFLGYRVPSPYSADYLAANERIQSRILERLEREKPPLAWVGPAIRFDEAPTAIRSYRIFRWFIERGYRFEASNGNQFLVRPDRLIEPEAKEEWRAFSTGVMRSDLAKLPISWGRNFERLRDRFTVSSELAVNKPESGLLPEKNGWMELRSGLPRFEFPIEQASSIPRPDYLLLTLGRRGPPNSRLRAEVTWTAEDTTFTRGAGLAFPMAPGTLLIPLGSHIGWHRSKDPRGLRIEITGETIGSKLRIENAQLLRLVR